MDLMKQRGKSQEEIDKMAEQFKDRIYLQTLCRPAKWDRNEHPETDDEDDGHPESMNFNVGDVPEIGRAHV